jgi:hypothetical protein
VAYPADWLQWPTGVLQGLGAQVSPRNLATQTAPGSTPEVILQKNPLVVVQSYPSIAEGVHATLNTLHNGFYPQIDATLVSGRPASQWQNACAELQTWGAGRRRAVRGENQGMPGLFALAAARGGLKVVKARGAAQN